MKRREIALLGTAAAVLGTKAAQGLVSNRSLPGNGTSYTVPALNLTLAQVSAQYPAASHAGWASYSTDQGPIYSNGTRWIANSSNEVIYATNYGIDPTGAQPSDVALNLAIQDAITQKKKLILPSGLLSINSPLICFQGAFSALHMEGQGGPAWPTSSNTPQYPLNKYDANTVIYANFTDGPALAFNANRFSTLKNLGILGKNLAPVLFYSGGTQPYPTDMQASYITSGCRSARYSPYTAIAIDPFNTSTPPDGGYPGMTYPQSPGSGSSGIFLENVSIQSFVVGVAIATSGVQANGDTIRLDNCNIQYCDTAVVIGQSQSRSIDLDFVTIYGCRQGFDTLNYGSQNGGIPTVRRCTFQYLYRIFAFSASYGDANFIGCYSESILSLGQCGIGPPGTRTTLTFIGGSYDLQVGTAVCPPYVLETYAPTTFIGVTLKNLFSVDTADAINIVADAGANFIGCTFSGSPVAGLLPHIGLTYDGQSSGPVRFTDCYIDTVSAGGIKLSDNAARMGGLTSFNVLGQVGRLIATWQTQRVNTGNAEYDFLPGIATPTVYINSCSSFVLGTTAYTISGITSASSAVVTVITSTAGNPFALCQFVTFASVAGMTQINGLIGRVTGLGGSSGAWTITVNIDSRVFTAYSSGGTATVPTLTFICTTPQFLQINDILAWTIIAQGYSVNSYSVPALKIASVVGNAITCNYLFDHSQYSATGPNSTAALVLPYHWAPTQALTATTSTNATLTSVSPTTILMNGDFVIGAGLPANTRVVSGGGTASLVLNQATTASASGVALYFGRLWAPTLTAAF